MLGEKMFENELKAYDDNGFSILKSFFDESEVKKIKEEIQNYIDDVVPTLTGRDINYVDGEINSIHALHKSDNYFHVIANSEKVRTAAGIFLNATPELRGAELFAKPAKKGLSSPMHQDNFYWCVKGANALTMWVALDDCNFDNGGLTYYSGSHKFGVVEHVDSFAPGSSQKIKDDILRDSTGDCVVVTPDVKAGDVLVHHSLTFHGSDANLSERSRRGFTMQFKDKQSVYDAEMKSHYESRLNMQVAAREKNK